MGFCKLQNRLFLNIPIVADDVSSTINFNQTHLHLLMADHAGQLKELTFALVEASERASEAFRRPKAQPIQQVTTDCGNSRGIC